MVTPAVSTEADRGRGHRVRVGGRGYRHPVTNDATDHFVHVRGASEHNLRDVDVDIPRDAMVAFTGVSGSGKSSLAFGTLYAEAQRRYFESVAPYARRLLQQVGAPHVQEITGLPPAVALQQRRGAPELAVDGRHHHHAVQPAADALLARRHLPAGGVARLEAEAFSPNTAAGACPRCHGLGVVHDVAEELLVPDPSLSIREGAIAAWPGAWQGANLRSIVTRPGHRHRPAVAPAPEEGPGLAAVHRRAAVGADQARARPHRPRLLREVLERPQARHARAVPTPRASGCASGRCGSCGACPARRATAAGCGRRRWR